MQSPGGQEGWKAQARSSGKRRLGISPESGPGLLITITDNIRRSTVLPGMFTRVQTLIRWSCLSYTSMHRIPLFLT